MQSIAVVALMGALAIEGEREIKAGRMVVLRVTGAAEGAAILWDVPPAMHAETDGPRLIGSALAGTYRVSAIAISVDGKAVKAERVAIDVAFLAPPVPIPPAPPPGGPPGSPPGGPPAPPPGGKPDPARALMRLRMGSAGCTATAIGPRRADGRWDVLSAAHCIPRGITKGEIRTQDGKVIAVQVSVIDSKADLCWLRTVEPVADLPFANLAASPPAVGVKVWHAGYGVDRPGNREAGVVAQLPGSNGQGQFNLNVSSGDSGGGIFREDTGEWVGAVCCTRARGAYATVWAGGVERARAMRPALVALSGAESWEGWEPVEMPTCP